MPSIIAVLWLQVFFWLTDRKFVTLKLWSFAIAIAPIWLFHDGCMLDFFRSVLWLMNAYEVKDTNARWLLFHPKTSPDLLIVLSVNLFFVIVCCVLTCTVVCHFCNSKRSYKLINVYSLAFKSLTWETKLMASSSYPGCLAKAEVIPKLRWSIWLCTICEFTSFFFSWYYISAILFVFLVINKINNAMMWDSGYQVGTNSYWEAEPFDKRKTGKILGYHKCVTFLIQMSFGIPFLVTFFVLFQEHFQKQRIENSMGSSEPTAKQVCYLRTLFISL